MMRPWSAAAIAIAMAMAALPAHGQSMTGSWEGVGLQVNPDRTEQTWDIALTLKSGAVSQIDYPSLHCKGELKQLSRKPDMIEFEEKITSGNCEDGGRITLTLRSDRLGFFWWKSGSDIDASAVLHRAKTS